MIGCTPIAPKPPELPRSVTDPIDLRIEHGMTVVFEPVCFTRLLAKVAGPFLRGRVRIERGQKGAPWHVANVYVLHRSNRAVLGMKRGSAIGEAVLAIASAWAKKHERSVRAADRRHWRDAVKSRTARIASLTDELRRTRSDLRAAQLMVASHEGSAAK